MYSSTDNIISFLSAVALHYYVYSDPKWLKMPANRRAVFLTGNIVVFSVIIIIVIVAVSAVLIRNARADENEDELLFVHAVRPY